MIPVHRDNLRDAVIAVIIGGLVAWALSGCSPQQQQPPPSPTVAQLAPESTPTPAQAPRITGAAILAEQPPEVQQAIKEHAPGAGWPSFRWPRERLVPCTDHMTPLRLEVAPFQDVDLSLQPGEQIDGFALGDDERFVAAPMTSGDPASPTPHAILKCKVPATQTSGAIYTSEHIYRLALRCRQRTTVDAVSFYYPDAILQEMHAADTAPAPAPQDIDPLVPTVDPSKLNYAYKIDGPANIPWRPVKVMDDGTRVWIEMPNTTSPIAPVITGDGGAILNYRVRSNYYVIDSLFNRAQMAAGTAHVIISRSAQ
jgi:type IV secretion system protein TrbG